MTHEQIDRMVRKANPVRDPNKLGSASVPVLTTPLERRTEMQVDDRPTEVPADRNRWRGPMVGIAAAAVILVAGLVWLTRDNAPVAEPAPNARDIETVPNPDNLEDPPLAPGAYFVDTDGDEETATRGTFVIEGSGWTAVPSGAVKISEEFVMLLVLEVDQVWSPACASPSPAPQAAGPTAADLADQIAANGFTVREPLAPVNAFGHDGQHMLVEVPDSCSGEEHMAWVGPVWDGRYYQDHGQVVEFWFLDVEGIPIMVEAAWFPGTSPEEDVAELEAILDTLVITP